MDVKKLAIGAQRTFAEKVSTFLFRHVVDAGVSTKQLRHMAAIAQGLKPPL